MSDPGVAAVMLLEEGCPADLVLRGFSRERIGELTGVDVGYNGLAVSRPHKAVDRVAYRAAYVLVSRGEPGVLTALSQLAAGVVDEEQLALGLGLGDTEGVRRIASVMSAMGLRGQYTQACAMRRRTLREQVEQEQAASQPAWLRVDQDAQGLFPVGGPVDLSMRGHSREAIAESTGIDVGYNAAFIKPVALGLDRLVYRSGHVRHRVDGQQVAELLETYGRGELSRDDFLTALGLGLIASFKLKDLFGALGMSAEFAEADRRRRRTDMAAGMQAKFGSDNPFKLEQFQEKAADTREERYGGRYTLAPGSVLEQSARDKYFSRVADGSIWQSRSEEAMYQQLCSVFGDTGVIRQYRDVVRYPWRCDFYLPSLDLFVELNGSWVHGDKWFDDSDPVDVAKLQEWRRRDASPDYGSYASVIKVWTDTDVAKRRMAERHNLNYVALWDGSAALTDYWAWERRGFPVGQDWREGCSWAGEPLLDHGPERHLEGLLYGDLDALLLEHEAACG